MNTNRTIAVLCALCALSALPTHARVFDVQRDDPIPTTAIPSTAIPSTSTSTSPTTIPSTATPTHPYCLTCDPVMGQRFQLIRGDDEVTQCEDKHYCDCEKHTQMKCEGWVTVGLAFVPEKQACGYMFSCADWLSKHPSTASSPEPATSSTPATGASTATPATRNPATGSSTATPATMTTATGTTAKGTTAKGTTAKGTTATSRPAPLPVTTPKPSSAWANRATALTVVFLAAVAAL